MIFQATWVLTLSSFLLKFNDNSRLMERIQNPTLWMDADSDSDCDEIFLIYFCDLMGWSWRGMSRSLIARSSMNNKYYWYSRSRFMECEVILVFFITLQLHRIISKGSQDCSLEIYYATNEQLHKQFRKKHDVKKLFSYKIIAEICEPHYWFCIFLDWQLCQTC